MARTHRAARHKQAARAAREARRVTMLAVATANLWKLTTARALVEGTDFIVIGMDEPRRLQQRVDELLAKVQELEGRRHSDIADSIMAARRP